PGGRDGRGPGTGGSRTRAWFVDTEASLHRACRARSGAVTTCAGCVRDRGVDGSPTRWTDLVGERPGELRRPDRLDVLAGPERGVLDALAAFQPRAPRLEADHVLVVQLRREPERDVPAAGHGGVVVVAGPVHLAEVVTAADAQVGAHLAGPLEDAPELARER